MLSCCVMHEMHVGFRFWFVSLSLQCMVLFCHNEEISSHLLNLFHYFLRYTLHSNAKNSFQNFLRKCPGLSVDHTFDPTRWEFLSVRVKPVKLLCGARLRAELSAGKGSWHCPHSWQGPASDTLTKQMCWALLGTWPASWNDMALGSQFAAPQLGVAKWEPQLSEHDVLYLQNTCSFLLLKEKVGNGRLASPRLPVSVEGRWFFCLTV